MDTVSREVLYGMIGGILNNFQAPIPDKAGPRPAASLFTAVTTKEQTDMQGVICCYHHIDRGTATFFMLARAYG